MDAVVCLSTSLPHLQEHEEILRALQSMRGVLRDGGILVVDQGMTDRQWMERPRFLPAMQSRDLSRLLAIDYGETAFTVYAIDFVHQESVTAFHVDRFDDRTFLGEDNEMLLRRAGFAEVTFFGGFEEEPYDPVKSRRLICVVVRG